MRHRSHQCVLNVVVEWMVTTTTKAKTTTAVARPVCWPWRSTTWRYRVTSHRPRPHAVSHSWFVVTAGFSGSVTLTGNINNRVIDSLASRRTSDDCHKQTMSSVIECVLATYVYELWRAESLLLRVICWTKKEWHVQWMIFSGWRQCVEIPSFYRATLC